LKVLGHFHVHSNRAIPICSSETAKHLALLQFRVHSRQYLLKDPRLKIPFLQSIRPSAPYKLQEGMNPLKKIAGRENLSRVAWAYCL
jgi:hypothetical protein